MNQQNTLLRKLGKGVEKLRNVKGTFKVIHQRKLRCREKGCLTQLQTLWVFKSDDRQKVQPTLPLPLFLVKYEKQAFAQVLQPHVFLICLCYILLSMYVKVSDALCSKNYIIWHFLNSATVYLFYISKCAAWIWSTLFRYFNAKFRNSLLLNSVWGVRKHCVYLSNSANFGHLSSKDSIPPFIIFCTYRTKVSLRSITKSLKIELPSKEISWLPLRN